jgi:hypothetical protein
MPTVISSKPIKGEEVKKRVDIFVAKHANKELDQAVNEHIIALLGALSKYLKNPHQGQLEYHR